MTGPGSPNVDAVIDLHCHVLPGIDDGPETIEGSLALARAAAAAGTRTLVATPHVSWRYPNERRRRSRRLVDEVNARLAAEEVDARLRPGAEIAMTRLIDIDPARAPAPAASAGGHGCWSSRPSRRWRPAWTPSCWISSSGATASCSPIPSAARPSTATRGCWGRSSAPGVLTSITAGSLVGSFGEHVRRFALELARDGLVHNVASDAHDRVKRPPGMAAELKQAGLARSPSG